MWQEFLSCQASLSWSRASLYLLIFLISLVFIVDMIYLSGHWMYRKYKGRKL
jgi:hypothetical protein